jgi:hypothetical protein
MQHRVDAAAAVLASRQWGLFNRRQARSVGSYASLEERRVASALWTREHENVFGLPGWPQSFERSVWLAILAADERAMASHESAAALRRMPGFPPRKVSIIVPHGHVHESPFAVVHQTRLFPRPFLVHGIPTTSTERTLCDIASVAGPKRVGRALDDACLRGTTAIGRVQTEFLALARPGRPGVEVMRAVLDQRVDGYVPTRSELENELDSIIATIPVPPPKREAQIGDRVEMPQRVDRLFIGPARLIVEGDGRLWHARLDSLESDRRRDRRALTFGYPTARYGYYELCHDRENVRAELCVLLGVRP